jgi:hypothetical protein
VELGPLGTSGTEWPIVPDPGDCDDGAIGGMKIGRGNRSTWRKLPQRHFVHQKSHLRNPGSNPGRRGGKPATNRLSYGAAHTYTLRREECWLRNDTDQSTRVVTTEGAIDII